LLLHIFDEKLVSGGADSSKFLAVLVTRSRSGDFLRMWRLTFSDRTTSSVANGGTPGDHNLPHFSAQKVFSSSLSLGEDIRVSSFLFHEIYFKN
jgi:hypothetical protein